MDKFGLYLVLVSFAGFGCTGPLPDEDSAADGADVVQKNSQLKVDVAAYCSAPCTVAVSGLPAELVQGVRYYINGMEQAINTNWWSGYSMQLPASISGEIHIKAELINLSGWTIASGSGKTVIQGSGQPPERPAASNEPAPWQPQAQSDRVRLENSDTCPNPCKLKASVEGAVTQVEFYAGGYYLGKAGSFDNFTFEYTFSQSGQREIRIVGYNWGGQALAEHRRAITIAPAQSASPWESTPSGYNAVTGNRIADAAYAIATRRNTTGRCYTAAADAIESVTGPFLWGSSAYQAADQLRASSWFTEVSVGDLRQLPAGAVVVWGRGSSAHGHISIALGNGREASDHVANQMTYHYGGAPARVFYPR